MRVKDIFDFNNLKGHFEADTNTDIKDRKKAKIRNGLKTVGKIGLKTLMVLGGIAGFALPMIQSGTMAAKVATGLVATSTAGEMAELCVNAGEVFEETKGLKNTMEEAEMGA